MYLKTAFVSLKKNHIASVALFFYFYGVSGFHPAIPTAKKEPMIMRWSGVIAKGTECDVLVVQTDFMPTFRAISGAKTPSKEPIDDPTFD